MSSVTEILVVGCIGENVGFENVYEIWGVFWEGVCSSTCVVFFPCRSILL